MSESVSSAAFENTPVPSREYQMVEMLTDEVLLEQDREHLRASVEQDTDLKRYSDLESAVLEATVRMYAAQREGRKDTSAEYAETVAALAKEQAELPADTKRRYHGIQQRIRMLESFRARVVEPDSIEAAALLDALHAAPSIQPPPTTEAPFKSYQSNTKASWRYVAPDAIEDYLKDKIFIDPKKAGVSTDNKNKIQIQAQPGEKIDVPLGLLVYAQGFDSWNGREGMGSGKDVNGPYAGQYDRKIHSSDVIKHYASLETQLPPVSEINVYIQPDGTMFADNAGGDSHRIAAAILRGQENISAEAVNFVTVDKNIIETTYN